MIRVPKAVRVLGSSREERTDLGATNGFHPSLLADELDQAECPMEEFFIDRFPVTNAEYGAFLDATRRAEPLGWHTFATAERAAHPVVGVTADDAQAYAVWAGRRLPTPLEWEAALRGASCEPIASPLLGHWYPRTCGAASERCRSSSLGVGGFGQVCEWTSATMPHHSTTFQLLKGAAWLMEEPWSFRPQASMWVVPGLRTAFIGFRCAADADAGPGHTASLRVSGATSEASGGSDEPHFRTDGSKNVAVQLAGLPGYVGLNCPEAFSADGEGLIHWYTKPGVAWETDVNGPRRQGSYSIQCASAAIRVTHSTGSDFHDFEYEMANTATAARTLSASTCVRLSDIYNLYDVEGKRTYIWTGRGDWIPLRMLPRTSDTCTRWIVTIDPADLPGRPGVLLGAVLARDGKSVFGYGRADLGETFRLANNYCYTCLHIDPGVRVEAGGRRSLTARLYYLRGGLGELRDRFAADFGIPT